MTIKVQNNLIKNTVFFFFFFKEYCVLVSHSVYKGASANNTMTARFPFNIKSTGDVIAMYLKTFKYTYYTRS